MTSFNAVGAILPLDEYYKNCVHPKPLIPPRYPGAKLRLHHQAGLLQEGQAGHRKVGHRQAGNVRSYKDEKDSDEDEDEPVGTGESVEESPNADSEFKSNVTQINYEMNDFDKNYCDETSPWKTENSNSLQGRRYNTNNTRRWNKHNRNQNRRKNNENTHHHSGVNQNQNRAQQQQQARLMLQQRMRFAYNSFKDNNVDQSPNALINHKYNSQTIPQNPQDMGQSSTSGSMTGSVANLCNSRTYNQSKASYETAVPPLNDVYAANRAQVNALPQSGNPMEFNSSDTDGYTIQQVARHVMLMMKTVRNIDTQETPEYFKSKKSINAAGGESHKPDQPEGFN